MAATSDERREVAGRLRGMDAQDHDNEVCVDQNPSGGGAFEPLGLTAGDLADLIDPTCENTKRRTEIYDRSFRCSACGYETWTYDDSDCDPWTFAYCPECGCRVVGGDGR